MRDGSYFALPRLIIAIRGRNATRSENNALEAYNVGVAVYIIGLAFFAAIMRVDSIAGFLLLAFGTWVFWLLIFYLNFLLTSALRLFGIGRDLCNSRMQNVLVGIETCAFALVLINHSRCFSLFGWVWLALTSLNLLAAVLLRLLPKRAGA